MKKSRHHDDIHRTPDVSHVQNPDVAHEESDVNVKAILQFVGGLLFFGIIVCVLMLLLFKFFEAREARMETQNPAGPMAFKENEKLPPEPRLQVAPGFGVQVEKSEQAANAEEIKKIGNYDEKTGRVSLELNKPQAEMEVLNQLWKEQIEKGTRDPNSGAVVGLPIEEAKKRLVEENLPARAPKPGQKDGAQGQDVPSYESSGRMTEKRDQ